MGRCNYDRINLFLRILIFFYVSGSEFSRFGLLTKVLQDTGIRQVEIETADVAIPALKTLKWHCSTVFRTNPNGKAFPKSKMNRPSSFSSQSICCFGDSLTFGFRASNAKKRRRAELKPTSYSLWLQNLFTKEFKKGKSVVYKQWENTKVICEGVPGETLSEMTARLKHLCAVKKIGGNNISKSTKAEKVPYSMIIILGGTNDICCMKSSEDIVQAIFTLTSTVATLGIPSFVLCTIPELGVELTTTSWKARRERVNEAIRTMKEVTVMPFGPAKNKSTRIVVCDLASELPPQEGKGTSSAEFWSYDGIHLTKKGYERMAGIIFSRIISTSMVTRNELLAKEKQERLQQKKEARIRKQADKEEKEREALRLLKIQEDAEKKAREKYRSAALDAGAPARAAKAKRLADEAEERNKAAKIVEDARLAKEAELEKERIDTEMMEEEDRLVRVYVRQEKHRAREEAKLIKVDDIIVKLVQERLYLTREKLLASLLGRLKWPVPVPVLKSRIHGLLTTRGILVRDEACPDVIFHKPTVEVFIATNKKEHDLEVARLREESISEMKTMAEDALKNSKVESFAEKKLREQREQGILPLEESGY